MLDRLYGGKIAFDPDLLEADQQEADPQKNAQ